MTMKVGLGQISSSVLAGTDASSFPPKNQVLVLTRGEILAGRPLLPPLVSLFCVFVFDLDLSSPSPLSAPAPAPLALLTMTTMTTTVEVDHRRRPWTWTMAMGVIIWLW
jgi:hypothetical protein